MEAALKYTHTHSLTLAYRHSSNALVPLHTNQARVYTRIDQYTRQHRQMLLYNRLTWLSTHCGDNKMEEANSRTAVAPERREAPPSLLLIVMVAR